LTIKGEVRFEKGVVIRGSASFEDQVVPAGTYP
jgi:hypothetical protein